MSMNFEVVGRLSDPETVEWTSRDVMLYALGVGAGQARADAELQFTTENTQGMLLQSLPTFALLHGEQRLHIYRPLSSAGSAQAATVVDGIYKMVSRAMAAITTTLSDPTSGQLLYRGVLLDCSSGVKEDSVVRGHHTARGHCLPPHPTTSSRRRRGLIRLSSTGCREIGIRFTPIRQTSRLRPSHPARTARMGSPRGCSQVRSATGGGPRPRDHRAVHQASLPGRRAAHGDLAIGWRGGLPRSRRGGERRARSGSPHIREGLNGAQVASTDDRTLFAHGKD